MYKKAVPKHDSGRNAYLDQDEDLEVKKKRVRELKKERAQNSMLRR